MGSSDEWPDAARHLGDRVLAARGAGTAVRAGHGHSGLDARRPDAVSVSVRHVRGPVTLDVETGTERDWPAELTTWRLVSTWSHLVTRPDRVTFPLRLQADRWEQDVAVDGVAVAFVFVGDATTWSALGRTSTRQIALTGDGWPHDGLALETVDAGAVAADGPD